MDTVDLSICIPTFNRAASVTGLVSKILSIDDPRIEIVVLDNASSDRTVEQLNAIAAARLSVYSNGVNRGVLFNILNALDKAKGRYAILLLDKDQIDPSAIARFRQYLTEHRTLACGYCEYGSTVNTEGVLYERGLQALGKIAYIGHHPTGYFFNTALLKSLNFLERFSNFDFVGHFPFDFMFAELALLGDAAVYHSPIFFPETAAGAAKHRSIGTNASIEDAFFSPAGRLKTAINFSRHIETLAISVGQKDRMIVERFVQGLVAATIGYRSVMACQQLCIHYHTESRRVGVKEMVTVAIHFHRRFLDEAIRGSGRGDCRRTIAFHARVLTTVAGKLLRKLNAISRWSRRAARSG